MDLENHRIYRIVGGTAKKLWEEMNKARQMRLERLSEFKKKFGASGIWVRGDNACGIIIEGGAVPCGWRRIADRHVGYYSPDKRLREGKEFAKELEAINAIFSQRDWYSKFFIGDPWYCSGFTMHTPSVGMLPPHECPLAVVHEKAKCKPVDGMEEMRLSEFYAAMGK